MASALRMRKTISAPVVSAKGETAVHGCHCRCDMVVSVRKGMVIQRSWYVCFSAKIDIVLKKVYYNTHRTKRIGLIGN